jgi:hypothetical protein
MRDEMDARLWEAHGREFSDDLHRLLRAVMVTFCRMAAINFAAPWRKRAGRC